MADYGVGALGGVVLIDPTTGLPYKAAGGGGGGDVASVNGKTGVVVLNAADVGLGNVDNTSDANKPVSTAQAAALALKVDAATLATFAQFVIVNTGSESRPAGGFVLWLDMREGEVSAPPAMGASDVRFRPGSVGPLPTAPTITTTALDALTQGSAFSQALAATGTAPITWAVTAGTLPAGLTLSAAGVLSGTPTGSGAYSFTATATNGAGADGQPFSGSVAPSGGGGGDIRHVLPEVPYLSLTAGNDGGGALYASNRFYSSGPSFRVRGARLFIPAAATGTILTEAITLYAWAEDYTGTALNTPAYATPTQSKVHAGPRVAGQWIEVLFDAPFTIAPIAPATGSPDVVTIGMRSASGNLYVAGTSIVDDWRNSVSADGVGFAERDLYNGYNSIQRAASTWYGLDLLYEVI